MPRTGGPGSASRHHACIECRARVASHVRRTLAVSSTYALAVLTLVRTPMKGHELLPGIAYSAIYGVRHSPLYILLVIV